MKGSLPLVKVGLQISDPLYSVLDISRSNIKDVSRVTGWSAFTFVFLSLLVSKSQFSFTDYLGLMLLMRLDPIGYGVCHDYICHSYICHSSLHV